ncbi:period, partial [Biomphalaria glabrata]
SEMATALQSKEKKKEKAKEFMKKLKSMLPMKERAGKMDTLSTLEQLVNNMRQLN